MLFCWVMMWYFLYKTIRKTLLLTSYISLSQNFNHLVFLVFGWLTFCQISCSTRLRRIILFISHKRQDHYHLKRQECFLSLPVSPFHVCASCWEKDNKVLQSVVLMRRRQPAVRLALGTSTSASRRFLRKLI